MSFGLNEKTMLRRPRKVHKYTEMEGDDGLKSDGFKAKTKGLLSKTRKLGSKAQKACRTKRKEPASLGR